MKAIGKVKVISVEEYQRKDGSKGYRCVGMSDESQPCVFYRPAEEAPKVNSEYVQVLGYDGKLSAVVRYQLANDAR
jgi:hypothetical protein